MEEETKFGVMKIMKNSGERVLWRDGNDTIFSMQNVPSLRYYLDLFFASEGEVADYEMVSLDTYLGRTHGLTSVIGSADIL